MMFHLNGCCQVKVITETEHIFDRDGKIYHILVYNVWKLRIAYISLYKYVQIKYVGQV